MINGLMVTLTGEELQRLLSERADEHRRGAAFWMRERKRSAVPAPDEVPIPEQMCEHEAERERWRVDVLMFLHDHLDPSEIYRLGRQDLALSELLPPKPGWMEQEEYEARMSFRTRRAPSR